MPINGQTASMDANGGSNNNREPILKPFAYPDENSNPPPALELSSEQISKYDSVLKKVISWTDLPTSSMRNAGKSKITDTERMWLTRECIFRYLRATKWDVPETERRLMATLIWRREYLLPEHDADYISSENETGKQVIMGYDINCAPCLYLFPGKQNSPRTERQIQHLVFMLERVIDLMPPGQEALSLLITFVNSGGSGSSVGQGKQVLYILQNHYPERLAKALISEVPWYVTTFFKIISPLIDPRTKAKMVFNEPFVRYVPSGHLLQSSGGSVNFTYDHSVYWPELNKMCADRRARSRKRWEDAGKRIGEYEAYLRGGDQKPLKDITNA